MKGDRKLSASEKNQLIDTLKQRFDKYTERHTNIKWTEVLAILENKEEKLWSLYKMEETGGEPDVVGQDVKTGEFIFIDCSAESPKERRSICYDREALDARKQHKPVNSAVDIAGEFGVELLTEEQYHELQKIGKFDLKTSSWIKTPDAIRKLGGALFCDRRYDHVFTYHNGADSYYAARGFRAILKV